MTAAICRDREGYGKPAITAVQTIRDVTDIRAHFGHVVRRDDE